jgi:ATP-dependent RNA helicase RhlE
MKFTELKIIDPILKSIEQAGYLEPTDIQIKAIPILLEGRDLLGSAQTGTGKTAAFAIPILQRLYLNKNNNQNIQALILAPTRELAAQIGNSFKTYGRHLGLKTTVVYGGVSKSPQIHNLKMRCDILVATPGRLLDLMNMGFADISHIKTFVLDEADQMLDMGFLRDINRIVDKLSSNHQTLMFSATIPSEIEQLAARLFTNPVRLAITPVTQPLASIDQSLYFVGKKEKADLLIELLKNQNIKSLLIFTRTKHGANKLTEKLQDAGFGVGVIHGNKSQPARTQALNNFKNKIFRILVATDIASRGIDIVQLSHVLNYDLPQLPELYLHRMGRTGRAGFSGSVITLCSEEELSLLKAIEHHIKMKVPVINEHDFKQSFKMLPAMNYSRPARNNTKQYSKRTYNSNQSSQVISKWQTGNEIKKHSFSNNRRMKEVHNGRQLNK